MATHNANISIVIFLAALSASVQSFGLEAIVVPLSTNPLAGHRSKTYTSASEAAADVSSVIDATAALEVAAAFAQSPPPSSVMVAYYDDVTGAVAAGKAFGSATGPFDTVIEAHTGGTAGNSYHIALIPDSAFAVTIEIDGYSIYIHYQPAVSTITNVETAIAALSGASDVIDVKTGGTGATILAAVDAREFQLSGGTAATFTETAAQTLAAMRAYADTFYGVTTRSNVTADILAWAAAVQADGEKFYIGQTAVAAGATDAAFAAAVAYTRFALVYHPTATEYNDHGYLAKGLAANPDVESAGWAGLQVAGVTAPVVTDADRLTLIGDNVNVMGSMYGIAGVMDSGVRYDGGEIKERITADWLRARIRERLASLWVKAANRFQPITLDARGVAQVESIIDQTFQQAEAAHHTTVGTDSNGDPTPSYRVTSRTINTSTRKITIAVAAQLAGTARLFDFNFYLDNDPVPTA